MKARVLLVGYYFMLESNQSKLHSIYCKLLLQNIMEVSDSILHIELRLKPSTGSLRQMFSILNYNYVIFSGSAAQRGQYERGFVNTHNDAPQ
jgi:hypothetical protein